jgi:thioredoxin reductase (NADPH)
MAEIRETVILGSGCAGLTAALYTARAGLKPLVLEGHEPGGQLSITTLVENFPGWPEGIQGPELIGNMKKQAARFGAEYQHAHLETVEVGAHPIKLRTSAGELHARTLIVASGASARWLGLPSEQALIGHGVSSCATCDGFFFRDKDIAVIGGGDSAMEEAIFLSRFASKVTLLHRRDAFRASKIMLERAVAHPKIELRTNTVVDEVLGVDEKEVKGLRLRDVKSGEQDELKVSGMFLGIGHVPNTKAFVGQIDLDEEGYIKTTNNVFTTRNGAVVPGVTGRRLPRPARDAWQRLKWRSISKSAGTEKSNGRGNERASKRLERARCQRRPHRHAGRCLFAIKARTGETRRRPRRPGSLRRRRDSSAGVSRNSTWRRRRRP